MYIILDLIKYFAKFPDRTGILKTFSRSAEKLIGYTELKTYIEALGDPLVPEIKDFVVSSNEEVISTRIRNISSFFMLLEYAGLQSSPPNRAYIRDSVINLSVIVAYPGNKPGLDIIEEQIIMDQALEMITTIALQMDEDNKEMCSVRRFMPGSVNISPVEPAMLYGCVGWALTFSKSEPLFNEA
jgi:hypothetical protein